MFFEGSFLPLSPGHGSSREHHAVFSKGWGGRLSHVPFALFFPFSDHNCWEIAFAFFDFGSVLTHGYSWTFCSSFQQFAGIGLLGEHACSISLQERFEVRFFRVGPFKNEDENQLPD